MNTFQRFFTNKIACSYFIPNKIRNKLLRRIGRMSISPKARIMSDCFFDTDIVSIGESSFVNRFCQFHDGGHGASIVIKDNCMVAMNVNFCAVSHEIGDKSRRAGKSYIKPINVESGCWIGANVIILPGITIGEGCIIGAGSVVNRDCEPNSMYAGNPAKKIKDLT